MQKHDRKLTVPAIAERIICPENAHTDLAQTDAAKAETAPLVDGPLYLHCFGKTPNAFVS